MSAEDDFSLFAQQMRDVKRLRVDRAETGKKQCDGKQFKYLRANAEQTLEAVQIDGLSDQFILDVHSEEVLLWHRDGIQESQLRRLKAGQIIFDGSIDLHGMSVEKARRELWAFLAEATHLEVRCVRVTHGKANRLKGCKALLKSHVNTWLRQHEKVLAFSSCQPRHGGAGALYVLLRRNMLEGRDEPSVF